MEIKWDKDPQTLISSIKSDIEVASKKMIDAVSKEIEQKARQSFQKAIPYIPADNPNIDVSRVYEGKSATIICGGEQVLFVEFGAGSQNKMTQTETLGYLRIVEASTKIPYRRVVWIRGNTKDIPARGFSFNNNSLTETAPRPSGIVPLGQYGKRLGSNDFWIYKSQSGRLAIGDEIWRINAKGITIKTKGIAPVRALWQAKNYAINKLMSGRLKIK